MSRDGEMEKLLGDARLTTTTETDERVLGEAARGMRRPWWPSLAAAAALIVVALLPLAAERGEGERVWDGLYVSNYSANTVSAIDLADEDGELMAPRSEHGYSYAGGAGGGGAGGTVNLDDVTNGLEDGIRVRFSTEIQDPSLVLGASRSRPGAKRPGKPADRSRGYIYINGSDGDYRGRTENLFREQESARMTFKNERDAIKAKNEQKGLPGEDVNLTPSGGFGFGLFEEEDNTEQYDAVVEADYSDPRHEPLSTFSIDVDTASMANVRRFLDAGRLPPSGAVRIEEMINYFSYDYPEPTGDQPFSVTTEVADCPWNPGHRLVHVGIQGKRMTADEIPARNLVFLLDVSGSMSSPNKLALVKAAMTLLTAQLRDVDRVGIVVYAGASGVVLEPTSGANSQAILGAIGRLDAGGSTNGGAGIRLAYDLAKRFYDSEKINRVILATDGDFNVGTTSRDELLTLIEEKRKTGIFLTVLGVGTGNLKDGQMEMLADKGNGNYSYLDSLAEAKKVLVEEAGGTLVTIAKDVKIQVEFNPDKVGAYRLIGYDNRVLAARDFNDDTKDAGEIGAGHSVTAIYEIAGPEDRENVVDPLKYQKPYVPGDQNYGDEILTAKLRYKKPDGDKSRLLEYPLKDPGESSFGSASRDFQFSAAVAAFGLLLKDSKYKGQAGYGMVEELVHSTLGEDPFGYRKDLLGLVGKAKALASRDQD